MNERKPTLRERQRTETRRAIQAHAVRLFTGRGYDEVTVADVAGAAGVSAMTVYRHFPTKEDLVLVDQPARLIADRVAASPAEEPVVRRVGGALVEAAALLAGGGPVAGGEASTGGGPSADGAASGAADGVASGAVGERFLLDCLRLMVATPALRARHLDSQYALQEVVVEALGLDVTDPATDPEAVFQARAATSACLAAMHTALTRWAADDGRTNLPELIARALTATFGGT
ncbi:MULTISPECIES: TetR family transcriptional regulator [Streptomyces]|nr:TetR family transcriptional regulator [Streptomyces venezuelae]APE23103.1 TetR family transcriptional regulator [Streptomyces venezuelae]QES00484.1 TetR/AcrR family transcriptional regulator [Streptomyces venezuelae ATCC 10712]